MNKCPEYCGVACVDGSCPLALQEQFLDIYIDSGIPMIKNCKECHLNYGCLDCANLNNKNYCPKFNESGGKDGTNN